VYDTNTNPLNPKIGRLLRVSGFGRAFSMT
jgi:hypothetical protein